MPAGYPADITASCVAEKRRDGPSAKNRKRKAKEDDNDTRDGERGARQPGAVPQGLSGFLSYRDFLAS